MPYFFPPPCPFSTGCPHRSTFTLFPSWSPAPLRPSPLLVFPPINSPPYDRPPSSRLSSNVFNGFEKTVRIFVNFFRVPFSRHTFLHRAWVKGFFLTDPPPPKENFGPGSGLVLNVMDRNQFLFWLFSFAVGVMIFLFFPPGRQPSASPPFRSSCRTRTVSPVSSLFLPWKWERGLSMKFHVFPSPQCWVSLLLPLFFFPFFLFPCCVGRLPGLPPPFPTIPPSATNLSHQDEPFSLLL